AWNPQHAKPNIRAKVGRLAIFAHAREADVSINDKRRRKGQSVSHGYKLHKRMKVSQPAVTGTVSNGFTKVGYAVKDGSHSAVLGENIVLAGSIPVDRPVVTPEEEQLVLLDWASICAAQIIEDAFPLARATGRGLEKLPGAQRLVRMVFK